MNKNRTIKIIRATGDGHGTHDTQTCPACPGLILAAASGVLMLGCGA
jgi:hypothetical protein